MKYCIKSEEDLDAFIDLGDLKEELEKVRLQEKIAEQGFHHDAKELFEPITKTVEGTSKTYSERLKMVQKQLMK